MRVIWLIALVVDRNQNTIFAHKIHAFDWANSHSYVVDRTKTHEMLFNRSEHVI